MKPVCLMKAQNADAGQLEDLKIDSDQLGLRRHIPVGPSASVSLTSGTAAAALRKLIAGHCKDDWPVGRWQVADGSGV